MKKPAFLLFVFYTIASFSQSYPPEAGMAGSTAIFKDNPLFVAWAVGISVTRGYVNISNPAVTAAGSNFATAGNPDNALGYPNVDTVSLGDGGFAVVTFNAPIIDGPGFDFAVFENGGPTYLELAFVEVSSDGVNFFRFPNHSQTQTAMQIGTFGTPSASYLNNLAGKYASEYGTPFDIGELPDNPFLDKQNITHVKIIDVVGSVTPAYASYDSFGNAVNDSFPTPFASCGFDLQAVGVINRSVLEVDDFEERKALCLYPNPANGYFYLDADEVVDVTILELSGRVVKKGKVANGERIDVSMLNPGTYIIRIDFDNHSENKKLIVK